MYCSCYLYHKINFTSPNEESLLWPSVSINSVNGESSCNRNIYCGQYVYQIPFSYSLQRGGHVEHLCLWLILIGRAWPWQRWKIQKFHAKSYVQIHYSALKSNIGSGNKLQIVSCLQSYFLSHLSYCGKQHITTSICVTGSKASCWCLNCWLWNCHMHWHCPWCTLFHQKSLHNYCFQYLYAKKRCIIMNKKINSRVVQVVKPGS